MQIEDAGHLSQLQCIQFLQLAWDRAFCSDSAVAGTYTLEVMQTLWDMHAVLLSPRTPLQLCVQSHIPTAAQLNQLPCMRLCCSHATHHHTAAGINGLEVGQTLVIALAIACHNLIELGGVGGSNPATRDGHLFSLILMAPLAGCTYGLAAFNWFPAQVCLAGCFVTVPGERSWTEA